MNLSRKGKLQRYHEWMHKGVWEGGEGNRIDQVRGKWRESVLVETTGIRVHLKDELETWYRGNSQESIWVSLVKTSSNERYGRLNSSSPVTRQDFHWRD